MFVPDDAYYTLAISRSLVNGSGPTVDGMTLTSGFQPLLAFATVPVFVITDDPDLPLRHVILLGALADVLTILLLARLARRVAGDAAALIAASLWAVSPLAIANALGGLETGLALCTQLALGEAWCVARERRTPRSYLVAGALAWRCSHVSAARLSLPGSLRSSCGMAIRGGWVVRLAPRRSSSCRGGVTRSPCSDRPYRKAVLPCAIWSRCAEPCT